MRFRPVILRGLALVVSGICWASLASAQVKDPFEGIEPPLPRAELAGPPAPTPPTDDHFAIKTDADGHTYFKKGQERYYTYYLAGMKEPSLLRDHERSTGFRFRLTWLRSFHDPVAIRIWQDGSEYLVRSVKAVRRKNGDMGPVTHDVTRKLTPVEWARLQKLMAAGAFMTPLNQREEEVLAGGMDGSRWIFETARDGKYCMIDYWTVTQYGLDEYRKNGLDLTNVRNPAPYAMLGLWLLDLVKLEPDREARY